MYSAITSLPLTSQRHRPPLSFDRNYNGWAVFFGSFRFTLPLLPYFSFRIFQLRVFQSLDLSRLVASFPVPCFPFLRCQRPRWVDLHVNTAVSMQLLQHRSGFREKHRNCVSNSIYVTNEQTDEQRHTSVCLFVCLFFCLSSVVVRGVNPIRGRNARDAS